MHDGNHMVSLLFMITSPKIKIIDNQIVLPLDSNVVLFSDRPHRIAKEFPGGIDGFANFYLKSDFTSDTPNVTFAGNFDADGKEYYSVFEFGSPEIEDQNISFPIINIIGVEKMVPNGTYSNMSLVVDNIWKSIGKAFLSGIEIGAAGIATIGACTVGEVATGGLDTAVCVAGVAGTAALAGNTVLDGTGD